MSTGPPRVLWSTTSSRTKTHTTTTLSVCIISTVFTDSHDDNTQCVYHIHCIHRLTRRQHSMCVSYPLYSQTHTTTTLSVCIISTVFTDSHDDNTQCVYIVSTVFTDSHDDNTQCVYHTTIPWPSSSPFTAYLGRGSRLASMLLSVLFSFPFPLTFLQRLSPSNAPSTLVVLSYLPILPNRPTTSHCDSPLKPTNYIAL